MSDSLRLVLERLASGQLTVDQARDELVGVENLGFARVDHDRLRRTGLPEVVYGPGKTREQLENVLTSIFRRSGFAMATRIEAGDAEFLGRVLPAAGLPQPHYDGESRLFWLGDGLPQGGRGPIAVCAAGTSDRPVAAEAIRTAELLGNEVHAVHDVGVAGLQRLFAVRDVIAEAEVVIAVAGMEGALFSVLKGLVPRPVVAVPTSVGGGFSGVAALMSALTACSSGVVTVGIDNGFGAAVAATLINRTRDG